MSDADPIVRHSPSSGPGSPDVWGLYEPVTGSIQYVLACPTTKQAALVDVVLDFDPKTARTTTDSAERVLALCDAEGLTPVRILDTHPHADHVMASAWLRERTGCPTTIGVKVKEIAALWREIYGLPDLDPSPHFDAFLEDGEQFRVGDLTVTTVLSPGHTLGSVSYFAGDAGLVHDTLMYPDAGSSRADFPGGSADDLWHSIRAILDRPGDTRLFVGHDYGRDARTEPAWEATVATHRAHNIHVRDGTRREAFVAMREARDATLALPDRMLHALQMNLRGGAVPAEPDGRRYLRIPLDRF